MKRDDVRLAEQVIYRNAVTDHGCTVFGARGDKNLHAKPAGDFRDPAAYIAVADDAELFSFELDRGIAEQSKN